jgi:hypothetical protein
LRDKQIERLRAIAQKIVVRSRPLVEATRRSIPLSAIEPCGAARSRSVAVDQWRLLLAT